MLLLQLLRHVVAVLQLRRRVLGVTLIALMAERARMTSVAARVAARDISSGILQSI